MKTLILLITLFIAISFNQCENEALYRCMYTADGGIPACFEKEVDDDENIKKACTALNGNFAEETCTNSNKVARCDGGKVSLEGLGIGNVDLGPMSFSIYSPTSPSAAENYCISILTGVYTAGQ